MDVPARRRRLTLRVLRRLARSLEPVLLSFLHPGIAGQQPRLPKRQPVPLWIELEQCASDPVADGAGLTGDAAALELDHHLEAALGAGHAERHPDIGFVDGVPEVLIEGTTVDHDLTLTRQEPDAGDGRLATTGAQGERGERHE